MNAKILPLPGREIRKVATDADGPSVKIRHRHRPGQSPASVSALTDVVRQLKIMVSARKVKVTATAAMAAGVAARSSVTLQNTKVTAPASAVST